MLHTLMTGLAATRKPCLGVESFLVHLEIHSFPVTELCSEILNVVRFSSKVYYQNVKIVCTLISEPIRKHFKDLLGFLVTKLLVNSTLQNVWQSLSDHRVFFVHL